LFWFLFFFFSFFFFLSIYSVRCFLNLLDLWFAVGNFGKILAVITANIFPSPLFLLTPFDIPVTCMLYLDIVPQFLDATPNPHSFFLFAF